MGQGQSNATNRPGSAPRFLESRAQETVPPSAQNAIQMVELCQAKATTLLTHVAKARNLASLRKVVRDILQLLRDIVADDRLAARIGPRNFAVNARRNPKPAPTRVTSSNFTNTLMGGGDGGGERYMQDILEVLLKELTEVYDQFKRFKLSENEEPRDPIRYYTTKEESEAILHHHLKNLEVFKKCYLDCYTRAEEGYNATHPIEKAGTIRRPRGKTAAARAERVREDEMMAALVIDLSLVLNDDSAKDFWDRYVGAASFACSKERFIASLKEELQEKFVIEMESLVDPTCDRIVSLGDFKTFLEWFGSFKEVHTSLNSLLEVGWFWGSICGTKAEILIKDRPVGTFIARFSETTPGSYAITVVEDEDKTDVTFGITNSFNINYNNYNSSSGSGIIIQQHQQQQRSYPVHYIAQNVKHRLALIEGDPDYATLKQLIEHYPITFKTGYVISDIVEDDKKEEKKMGLLDFLNSKTPEEEQEEQMEAERRAFMIFKGREASRIKPAQLEQKLREEAAAAAAANNNKGKKSSNSKAATRKRPEGLEMLNTTGIARNVSLSADITISTPGTSTIPKHLSGVFDQAPQIIAAGLAEEGPASASPSAPTTPSPTSAISLPQLRLGALNKPQQDEQVLRPHYFTNAAGGGKKGMTLREKIAAGTVELLGGTGGDDDNEGDISDDDSGSAGSDSDDDDDDDESKEDSSLENSFVLLPVQQYRATNLAPLVSVTSPSSASQASDTTSSATTTPVSTTSSTRSAAGFIRGFGNNSNSNSNSNNDSSSSLVESTPGASPAARAAPARSLRSMLAAAAAIVEESSPSSSGGSGPPSRSRSGSTNNKANSNNNHPSGNPNNNTNISITITTTEAAAAAAAAKPRNNLRSILTEAAEVGLIDDEEHQQQSHEKRQTLRSIIDQSLVENRIEIS